MIERTYNFRMKQINFVVVHDLLLTFTRGKKTEQTRSLQKTKKNYWILKRRQVFEQLFFVLKM